MKILLALGLLTSCSIKYSYTDRGFKSLIKEGKIDRVHPNMACHNDSDLQKDNIYYNFYDMKPSDIEIYSNFIPDFKNELQGTYSYLNYTENNKGIHLETVSDTKAHFYNYKKVSCDRTDILRHLKRRVDKGYLDIYMPGIKVTTLKIIPNEIINRFMKDKYALSKLKKELKDINKDKSKKKLTYTCVNDVCKYKEEKSFYSSYPINIHKTYTADYTGGFRLNMDYGFIIDSIDYIKSLPSYHPLRRMYGY